MIPTYNCADTLRRTLESILSQDPGPAEMQIEVVDDTSTRDDPEAVVSEIGKGRIAFFRQPRNLGHVGNFNTCIARSHGQVVHILHGDDWVKDGFYRRLAPAFSSRSDVGAAFCRALYCSEDGSQTGATEIERDTAGVIEGWFNHILSRQRLCTPSIVVRRDVYQTLGGFDPTFTTAGEDWEMWVRIAAKYRVWYEPEALACYTVRRPKSLTGTSTHTTRVSRDMRFACDLIEQRHGPLDDAGRLSLRAARLFYAGWSLNYAAAEIDKRGLVSVVPHLREAFLCYPTTWMAKRILKLVARQPLD